MRMVRGGPAASSCIHDQRPPCRLVLLPPRGQGHAQSECVGVGPQLACHPAETLAGALHQFGELRVSRQAVEVRHGDRVENAYHRSALIHPFHSHIAGKQQSCLWAAGQCLVGQLRVAGSKNRVWTKADAEFFLKYRVGVDPSDYAKSLGLEPIHDAGDCLIIGQRQLDLEGERIMRRDWLPFGACSGRRLRLRHPALPSPTPALDSAKMPAVC